MERHILYSAAEGWYLASDNFEPGAWFAGRIQDPIPFDDIDVSASIDNLTWPAHNDLDCLIWTGSIQGNGSRRYPYYLPHRPHLYPYNVPVRQLVLARHLNVQYYQLPRRIYISTTCDNERCINIQHMIPRAYRPPKIIKEQTEVYTAPRIVTEEEKAAIVRRYGRPLTEETPDEPVPIITETHPDNPILAGFAKIGVSILKKGK